MPNPAWAVVPDPKKVMLGLGAVYINYGEVDEKQLGATQGGGTFSYEQNVKEIEYDGALGDTKGMKRIHGGKAMFSFKGLELIDKDKIKYAVLAATVKDGTLKTKTYDMITSTELISDADYLKNVAFVGRRADGKEIIIILENALSDGKLEMAILEDKEVVPELSFTGHRDPANITAPPFKIYIEKTTP